MQQRVSISPISYVVWVFKQTQTEEVSMHPNMINALGHELVSERRREAQARALSAANPVRITKRRFPRARRIAWNPSPRLS